jgi:myo-inositol-1(or 4)-monophosphatase
VTGTAPVLPDGIADGELDGLLDLARSAALAAGELVHGRRPARVTVEATKSSPTDVVTAMDRAAEQLLRDRIGAARPHDGVLGEEAGLEPGTSGLTWVLDPIDGTVNYLYGLLPYAVSVALVAGDPSVDGGWTPVVGCVHAPATDQTWSAVIGRGAWLDGRRLRIPTPTAALDRALVGTGFGYLPVRRRSQARVLAELLPQVRDVRRMGSAAIDICLVAGGELDAYYERGVHVWDVAAASLVLTEAGGVMVGIADRPAGEDLTIAAAQPLAGILAGTLSALEAGRD